MKKTTLALIASLPLMVTPLAQAVSVSTSPVGFINLSVKGTDNGGMTAIAVPMLPQVLYSGVVSTVVGDTITDDAATWDNDDYAVPDPNGNSSYYVEITNHSDSNQIGTIFEITESSGSGKSLRFEFQDPTGMEGASYSIRKYRTIADVFGADNSAGLKIGGNTNEADVIYKVSGNTWARYFYQEAPGFLGGNGWRKAGDTHTDMSGVAISPDEGLLVRRKDPDDVSITLPGSIKVNDSRTGIFKGYNLVALSYPVDVTLSTLGLDDLQSGGNTNEADVVYKVSDTGQFERYFLQEAPGFLGGNGWRKAGDTHTDQSSLVIPAGSSVIINRRSDTPVDWTVSTPF